MSHLCKENERTLHGCTSGSSRQIEKEARHVRHYQKSVSTACVIIAFLGVGPSLFAATAPTTYSAYTGTDAKRIPSAPALGPANSIIKDPTFGSRILRVTDARTNGGDSLIPEYAGFFRTWNANSTALKLHGPHGTSYWLEFNPSTFKVGDGAPRPTLHPLSFNVKWDGPPLIPTLSTFKTEPNWRNTTRPRMWSRTSEVAVFRSNIMSWLSAQTLGFVRRQDPEPKIPIHRFSV